MLHDSLLVYVCEKYVKSKLFVNQVNVLELLCYRVCSMWILRFTIQCHYTNYYSKRKYNSGKSIGFYFVFLINFSLVLLSYCLLIVCMSSCVCVSYLSWSFWLYLILIRTSYRTFLTYHCDFIIIAVPRCVEKLKINIGKIWMNAQVAPTTIPLQYFSFFFFFDWKDWLMENKEKNTKAKNSKKIFKTKSQLFQIYIRYTATDRNTLFTLKFYLLVCRCICSVFFFILKRVVNNTRLLMNNIQYKISKEKKLTKCH